MEINQEIFWKVIDEIKVIPSGKDDSVVQLTLQLKTMERFSNTLKNFSATLMQRVMMLDFPSYDRLLSLMLVIFFMAGVRYSELLQEKNKEN
jgi:hypothetical protein